MGLFFRVCSLEVTFFAAVKRTNRAKVHHEWILERKRLMKMFCLNLINLILNMLHQPLHKPNAKISEIQKQFTKTDSPFAHLSKIVPLSSFIRIKPYPLIDKKYTLQTSNFCTYCQVQCQLSNPTSLMSDHPFFMTPSFSLCVCKPDQK